MNKITLEIVREIAYQYPEEAAENKSDFRFLVKTRHREIMLARFEWEYVKRAFDLFRSLHPDFFNEEGFLLDHIPGNLEIYLAVYQHAINVINRKIKRDPALKLEDWEHPKTYQEYQLSMF